MLPKLTLTNLINYALICSKLVNYFERRHRTLNSTRRTDYTLKLLKYAVVSIRFSDPLGWKGPVTKSHVSWPFSLEVGTFVTMFKIILLITRNHILYYKIIIKVDVKWTEIITVTIHSLILLLVVIGLNVMST